jgi:PAS domain S-box-containing protein
MKNSSSDSLRQKAEAELRKNKLKEPFLNEADTQRLIHELEVHQIELEMQNRELTESEEKSRKATEKYTSLYDFAPMGYFTLGPGYKIKRMNFSGARMVGKERFLLQDTDFRIFVSSESRNTFDVFFQKVFETESKQVCTVKLVREDHSTIVVYIEGVPDDDLECSLTIMDITSQELAQEKLHNSETRYRRLFESAKGGILILDFDTGRIVDVNPFLIELLGYSYKEFLGKELWEIGLFRDVEDSRNSFRELQVKEYIRFEDMPLKTKSGSHVNVEIVSNVYKIDNKNVIQCYIRDITKRKLAEEKLKETAIQLRELNATKDKFFSIIAHDLRSPFTAIIGYSELLVDKINHKNYEGIEEYARIIQLSSWRAMDFLSNLLEWARSQTGIMGFDPQIIEFSKLINEVTDLLNDSAIQKSIDIKVKIPQSFSIYADTSMIKTVLRNLISNAIKFTYPGGEIMVESSYTDSVSIVSVSDNGIGIKKDTIEKLFRIEESRSTVGTKGEEGTGLGLILCNDFIKKHGGHIWAESEYGKGSRFAFALPIEKKSGAS